MGSNLGPAFAASSRRRLSSFSNALSSTASFFSGWRSTPGTIPATSQLDKLSSITAISVLSCFRTIRDLLRSFGFCIGGLHRFTSATMDAISSPPPHSISPRKRGEGSRTRLRRLERSRLEAGTSVQPLPSRRASAAPIARQDGADGSVALQPIQSAGERALEGEIDLPEPEGDRIARQIAR